MTKLNDKQKRFAKEYIIDLNATKAAERAGYSKKTAYSQGQRLLKHVEIQTEIQKAMDERAKRTEITADRVVKEFAKIGFADITDFVEWQDKNITLKDSDKIDGAVIQEVSENVLANGTTNFSFKLYNKLDALKSLGKHLGIFDKQDNEQSDAVDEWVEAMGEVDE